MAGRGPQSFKKRQKEQARKEKQQEKAAKRVEKKLHPTANGADDDSDIAWELAPSELVAALGIEEEKV